MSECNGSGREDFANITISADKGAQVGLHRWRESERVEALGHTTQAHTGQQGLSAPPIESTPPTRHEQAIVLLVFSCRVLSLSMGHLSHADHSTATHRRAECSKPGRRIRRWCGAHIAGTGLCSRSPD